MTYYPRRRSRDYDGTALTAHDVAEYLPSVLHNIGKIYQQRPDLVLAAWPEIVGKQLAPMTEAVSFADGFLVVKVNNSTLYSLLSQNDRPRILKSLRQKFPRITIKNILFRMG